VEVRAVVPIGSRARRLLPATWVPLAAVAWRDGAKTENSPRHSTLRLWLIASTALRLGRRASLDFSGRR
jgi:hypothetical protein